MARTNPPLTRYQRAAKNAEWEKNRTRGDTVITLPISKIRGLLRLSQQEFAEQLSKFTERPYSASYVSRVEHGDRIPAAEYTAGVRQLLDQYLPMK